MLLRDIFLQQHRYVMAIAAAVDEAVLNVRNESIYCLSHFGAVVADELQPLCPSFRQRVVQFLSCLGCDLDGGAAGIGAWCETHPVLSTKNTSSKDGLRHRYHRDAWFAMVCAVLSLASPGFDTQWTSSLPPPTSPTLHCIAYMPAADKRTCTLVAEAQEKLGLHAQGIEWAQVGIA